jgi:hypothetical protein
MRAPARPPDPFELAACARSRSLCRRAAPRGFATWPVCSATWPGRTLIAKQGRSYAPAVNEASPAQPAHPSSSSSAFASLRSAVSKPSVNQP